MKGINHFPQMANDAYEELVFAIFLQAIKDYEYAYNKIFTTVPTTDKKKADLHEAICIIAEVECFLTGDWASSLIDMDPKIILDTMNEHLEEMESYINEGGDFVWLARRTK